MITKKCTGHYFGTMDEPCENEAIFEILGFGLCDDCYTIAQALAEAGQFGARDNPLAALLMLLQTDKQLKEFRNTQVGGGRESKL